MKNKFTSAIILLVLLAGMLPLASCVVKPNYLFVAGDIQPESLDPAWVAGIGSMELLRNMYETLTFFDRDKVDQFVPQLATSWTVSPDGLTYTFKIRGTDGTDLPVKFHNNQPLTTEDVEYSFERVMVQDRAGGIASLLYEPLLDRSGSRDEAGNIVVTSDQIDNAITHNDTTVTLHLAKPYPPFLQILSHTCSSIVNKEWCIALGEWPGTWENWTSYNNPKTSPIDLQNTEAPGPHVNAMCGTGPYYLEYVDHNLQEWSIHKFNDYWHGWPAPESKGFVEGAIVTWRYPWPDRRDMFLAGEVDIIDVPETSIAEVLGQPGVRCVYPLPELTCWVMFFTFNVSESSPYLGVPGGLPHGTLNESGIPPDFFNDIDVRKGFAYSFNYTRLIDEVLLGEACQPATPIILGLPFYNSEQEKYSINLTKAEEHFKKAWGGQLWTNGFNMTICYNRWSMMRQKACEIIKSNLECLNPKFHINIKDVDRRTEYLPQMESHELPIFTAAWAADFVDPHNFAEGFMYSRGLVGYAPYQNYADATVDALVEAGIREMDPNQRRQIYYDLQSIYHDQCPSVPLYQPIGRRFERDWVQGWYYNQLLYRNNYFYVQWREQVPPARVTEGNNTIDAIESSDTLVLIDTTASGNVTVSKYDIANTKCVTVDTTLSAEEIAWPIELRIYYNDEEIISMYVDQSTLRMYYWNETTHEWILEPDSGWVTPSDIPGYEGYVWAKIHHISLFTAMGQRNRAPTIDAIHAPLNPIKVCTSITASATFTDPNALDTHTATWDWGDGSTSAGIVDETSGSGTVIGSHVYTIPGVYIIRLTITDKYGDKGSAQFEYVVVYDPEGGFVTGGGWINSQVGAYTVDPSLTGKATFGFVSKYNKGATTPSGKTEFVFHVAGLKFQSSSYQWLVVAEARAQFKGSGTINGKGNYGFILTAIDDQINGGGGVDKFRIKIWDKATDTVVYDNQMGATDVADVTTEIKGGNIIIHKST